MNFISDSLIFENIDNISFILLILTVISTSFMSTGAIGIFAIGFSISCIFKLLFKKGEKINISFLNKIFIIYLLIVFISALGASYLALSLKGLLKIVVYAIFYFSAAYFLTANKKKIFPLILIISFIMGIEAFIGIFQNLSHIEAIATWQDTSNIDPTKIISRAYGTLKPYNPNLLAGYLVAGLSSFVALFLMNKKIAIFSCIGFLISVLGILSTGSRGAYLGLLGFFGVIFLYVLLTLKKKFGSLKKIKGKYKSALCGIVAGIFGLVFLVPSIRARIFSIFTFRGDSSISFRFNVYQASWQMFLDNPFLGIGVGNKNFREIYGLYMKTGFDALGTYCTPLEIAVESGIFALLFFAMFIIFIIARCIYFIANDKTEPVKKALLLSVLLTTVAVMFHGFFDTVFFRPQIQIIFWVNVGIFYALTRREEELNSAV